MPVHRIQGNLTAAAATAAAPDAAAAAAAAAVPALAATGPISAALGVHVTASHLFYARNSTVYGVPLDAASSTAPASAAPASAAPASAAPSGVAGLTPPTGASRIGSASSTTAAAATATAHDGHDSHARPSTVLTAAPAAPATTAAPTGITWHLPSPCAALTSHAGLDLVAYTCVETPERITIRGPSTGGASATAGGRDGRPMQQLLLNAHRPAGEGSDGGDGARTGSAAGGRHGTPAQAAAAAALSPAAATASAANAESAGMALTWDPIGSVAAMAFSPSGHFLAILSDFPTFQVQVWEWRQHLPVAQLVLPNAAQCVSFAPDCETLIAVSGGGGGIQLLKLHVRLQAARLALIATYADRAVLEGPAAGVLRHVWIDQHRMLAQSPTDQWTPIAVTSAFLRLTSPATGAVADTGPVAATSVLTAAAAPLTDPSPLLLRSAAAAPGHLSDTVLRVAASLEVVQYPLTPAFMADLTRDMAALAAVGTPASSTTTTAADGVLTTTSTAALTAPPLRSGLTAPFRPALGALTPLGHLLLVADNGTVVVSRHPFPRAATAAAPPPGKTAPPQITVSRRDPDGAAETADGAAPAADGEPRDDAAAGWITLVRSERVRMAAAWQAGTVAWLADGTVQLHRAPLPAPTTAGTGAEAGLPASASTLSSLVGVAQRPPHVAADAVPRAVLVGDRSWVAWYAAGYAAVYRAEAPMAPDVVVAIDPAARQLSLDPSGVCLAVQYPQALALVDATNGGLLTVLPFAGAAGECSRVVLRWRYDTVGRTIHLLAAVSSSSSSLSAQTAPSTSAEGLCHTLHVFSVHRESKDVTSHRIALQGLTQPVADIACVDDELYCLSGGVVSRHVFASGAKGETYAVGAAARFAVHPLGTVMSVICRRRGLMTFWSVGLFDEPFELPYVRSDHSAAADDTADDAADEADAAAASGQLSLATSHSHVHVVSDGTWTVYQLPKTRGLAMEDEPTLAAYRLQTAAFATQWCDTPLSPTVAAPLEAQLASLLAGTRGGLAATPEGAAAAANAHGAHDAGGAHGVTSSATATAEVLDGAHRKKLEAIQVALQLCTERNALLPPELQLSADDLVVDVAKQRQLTTAAAAEVAVVAQQLVAERAQNEAEAARLTAQLWDSMAVPGATLVAFTPDPKQPPPLKVDNIPVAKEHATSLARRLRHECGAAVRQRVEALLVRQGVVSEAERGVFGSTAREGPDSRRLTISQTLQQTHAIQHAFNERFDAELAEKRHVIGRIEEKNDRIREIMAELGVAEPLFTAALADSEQPERVLTVTDAEIGLAPPAADAGGARPASGRGDDWRRRALQAMMHGRLEDRVEKGATELVRPDWMSKPADQLSADERKQLKEFEKREQIQREEGEKRRKALETEMRKLLLLVSEETEAFNKRLFKLALARMDADHRIVTLQLRAAMLTDVCLATGHNDAALMAVIRDLEQLKTQRSQLGVQLPEVRKQAEKRREEMEYGARRLKEADKLFRRTIGQGVDRPDALFKLYKTGKPLAADKVEWPADVVARVNEAMARRETAVAEQQPLIDAAHRAQTIHDALQMDSDILKQQMADLQQTYQQLMDRQTAAQLNAPQLVTFKQGQVEIPQQPVVTDYRDALVIDPAAVKQLNDQIRHIGQGKVDGLVQMKDYRKGIRVLEWELTALDFQVQQVQQTIRDLQLLRLTKAMQEQLRSQEAVAAKTAQPAARATAGRPVGVGGLSGGASHGLGGGGMRDSLGGSTSAATAAGSGPGASTGGGSTGPGNAALSSAAAGGLGGGGGATSGEGGHGAAGAAGASSSAPNPDVVRLERQAEQLRAAHQHQLADRAAGVRTVAAKVARLREENAQLHLHIQEIAAHQAPQLAMLRGTEHAAHVADGRVRAIASRRKLVDLAKSQAADLALLRHEVERLRLRTYPSFAARPPTF
ncbi:hypothetical protein CXG81DRAFT_20615 [Caulochytrium protostelioides]|uniref:Cilia- and flagella-associated protein 43 n=1 Tax=Caulochytrium protostelioides TaxID=1555241 RepID=A0A4P9X0K9_9FUNG|nr:hypothetical protein CXG81DRAFT_20615 [Caulochytrium protostelioides]|eukprot:RKO99291.1 hypothetical protein CXG81DRAFT_20615 [Caulochytrium protostelioides]